LEDSFYENLYNYLQEEKKTGDLQPLPKDFYKVSTEYFNKMKVDSDSESATKQRMNFEILLTKLKERRKQKLLIYLAYQKKLPSKTPLEEEEIFFKIKNIIDNEPERIKISRIKINEDIPEIISPKGEKIGPLNKNQIIELTDKNEVEFLIKNKIGEII
jgi:DNA replication initiation complex subunit (GINS family)